MKPQRVTATSRRRTVWRSSCEAGDGRQQRSSHKRVERIPRSMHSERRVTQAFLRYVRAVGVFCHAVELGVHKGKRGGQGTGLPNLTCRSFSRKLGLASAADPV